MARFRSVRALGIVVLLLVLGASVPLGHLAPIAGARADAPLVGNIAGPTAVGLALQTTYTVTATGGPAQAANGTQVGIYSFKASFSAVNTTGASFTPTSGVLVNGSVTLSFTAPNVTEPLTLFVLVNSSYNGKNISTNLSAEHGLVTFAGGLTSYSVSFYVPGPAPNYTPYYLLGIFVFVAVILIYTLRVGAPRRGPKKK